MESPDSISWVVRPSARVLKRLPIVAVMLLTTFLCAFALFRSVIFSIAAVALVLLPNIAGIAPLTYRVSAQGACVSIGPVIWLQMNWQDVRSIACIKGGLKLSAFDNPATAVLESRRGIALTYPPDMATRVETAVSRLRAQASNEGRT